VKKKKTKVVEDIRKKPSFEEITKCGSDIIESRISPPKDKVSKKETCKGIGTDFSNVMLTKNSTTGSRMNRIITVG
jgi:hypothetical protein